MTPEMQCLLEAMRDHPGSISRLAGAGGAAAALDEIARLRLMAYQPATSHKPGCDCIQCVPF